MWGGAHQSSQNATSTKSRLPLIATMFLYLGQVGKKQTIENIDTACQTVHSY